MEAKYCAGCDKHVPLSDWTKHNSTADRLQHRCNHCRNAQRREARRNKKGHYATERERYHEQHKKACLALYYRYKKLVFEHYSTGTPFCCKSCGFNDERALSIDHIDGRGAAHRKQLNGVNLCKWLVKEGYPEGYQILCMNCQFIKRHEQARYGIAWGNTCKEKKEAT